MATETTTSKSINMKKKMTGLFAVFTGVLLLSFTIIISPHNYAVIIAQSAFAIILGWVFAFISAPYDKSDQHRLHNVSKLIGSFITGYIISKADNPLRNIAGKMFTDPVIGYYIMNFLGFFFLSWLVVYVFRVYED
jgi:hypothetical protein